MTSVYFIVFFHRVSTSALAPELVTTFGVSSTMLGLMASAYFYSYGLLQPVVGVLVDAWKARRVVTVAALMMGSGSVIFALAPNFWVAFVARVIIGMGAAGVFVPISWFITKWFSARRRAFIFSLLMMSGNTGAIVAAGPLGTITSLIGWRNTIGLLSIITFITAALAWGIVRDKPIQASADRYNMRFYKEKTIRRQRFNVIRFITKEPIMGYILLASFLSYGPLMAFQGLWGVPFLMDVYGFNKVHASNLLMVLPIGFICGAITLGRILDTRFGGFIAVVGYGVSTISYFVFTIATGILSAVPLFLCIFLLGFTHAVFPFMFKAYSEVSPPENFGVVMGICNASPFVGSLVFQLLTGFIFDLFPSTSFSRSLGAYKYFFLLLTIALAISTVAVFKVNVCIKARRQKCA